ncbi:MAG: S24 family peptidase [Pseudomonadota bacterium]
METGERRQHQDVVHQAGLRRVAADEHGDLAGAAELCVGDGFRKRLIATLDAAMVPKDARLAHLSALTGRVPQTSRRWIDPIKPGLPDLESFALLCQGLKVDANWFLGLTPDRTVSNLPAIEACPEMQTVDGPSAATWIAPMVQDLSAAATGCSPMKMPGDDMEPLIHDGDMLVVDFGTREIVGNGIYVVECDGRVMVRNVESRIGEGLVLSCANQKYQSSLVKNSVAAERLGLKVLGKARACIRILKFCRMN